MVALLLNLQCLHVWLYFAIEVTKKSVVLWVWLQSIIIALTLISVATVLHIWFPWCILPTIVFVQIYEEDCARNKSHIVFKKGLLGCLNCGGQICSEKI